MEQDDAPAPRGLGTEGAAKVFCLTFGAILVSLLMALPVVTRRRGANEPLAVLSLDEISAAQALFREGDKDGDGAPDFGSLAELAKAGLLDPGLEDGLHRGYRFEVKPSPTDLSCWWARATPAHPNDQDARRFFTNQSGGLWWSYQDIPAPKGDGPEPPEGLTKDER